VTLSGTIGVGSAYPPSGETVSVTINSVPQIATIESNGTFSVLFSTSSLTTSGSPYIITYSYAGDTNFNSAGDASTTLTVIPPTATISGEVFNDTKGNGVLTRKDKGMSGVTVSVQLKKGKKLKGKATTFTTGKSGVFTFTNLAPGTYQISAPVPAGYQQTAPAGGAYTLTVVAGEVVTGENFGNKKG